MCICTCTHASADQTEPQHLKAILFVQAAELLGHLPQVKVLPVEADEAHMRAAKSAVKQTRLTIPGLPYSA